MPRALAQIVSRSQVKELALEAGLAAGSIYVYLQGKEDILILIAESMVAELVESLPDIREHTDGEPRRELLEIMRTILDVIDRYREAFAVMNHEVRYLARRPEHRRALGKITDEYHVGGRARCSNAGATAGVIHFDDLQSVVHAIHMLCAGWATGANALKQIDKEAYWREIAGIIEGRFFARCRTSSEPASTAREN